MRLRDRLRARARATARPGAMATAAARVGGALERLLVDARGDDERRGALEAGELARLEQLDVARDRILGDARLEPRLRELVARRVDAHPRLCTAGGNVGSGSGGQRASSERAERCVCACAGGEGSLPRLEVVYAAQHEVDPSAANAARLDHAHEVLEVIHRRLPSTAALVSSGCKRARRAVGCAARCHN